MKLGKFENSRKTREAEGNNGEPYDFIHSWNLVNKVKAPGIL